MIGAYTAAVAVAVLVTVLVDLVVARTRLLRTKLFWASYAIVLFFQLIVNGVLTGFGVVQYDRERISGVRLAFAPIEDLGFGFALVTSTLVLWRWRENARARA